MMLYVVKQFFYVSNHAVPYDLHASFHPHRQDQRQHYNSSGMTCSTQVMHKIQQQLMLLLQISLSFKRDASSLSYTYIIHMHCYKIRNTLRKYLGTMLCGFFLWVKVRRDCALMMMMMLQGQQEFFLKPL